MRIVYQETGTYWRDVSVEFDNWFIEDFKLWLIHENSHDEAAIATIKSITEADIQTIMDGEHSIVYRYELVDFILTQCGDSFSDSVVDYETISSEVSFIDD